jgi:zinc D-Ala-D-Ala dipeptidase
MWNRVHEKMKLDHPFSSPEELIEMTEVWIANPFKEGSGHQTGAAVDLTLCYQDGTELDMGTKMQEFTPKSITASPDLTMVQKENRSILLQAMSSQDFVNYPNEWWHFSYGERLWASLIGAKETLFSALKD